MDLPAAGSGIRELRGPLFVTAAIVIVTVGIALAGGLFALLAFSALASIVARRAQFWLLDHGLPSWAALVVTVGGFILILVVMAVAVVASIAAVGFRLVEDSAQVQDWIDQAQAAVGDRDGRPRRHAAADRAAGGPRGRAERRVARSLRPSPGSRSRS